MSISNPPDVTLSDRSRMAYLDFIEDQEIYLHQVAINVAEDILETDDITDLKFNAEKMTVQFKVEEFEFKVTVKTKSSSPSSGSNHRVKGIHDVETRELQVFKSGSWCPVKALSDLGKLIKLQPLFPEKEAMKQLPSPSTSVDDEYNKKWEAAQREWNGGEGG